MLEQQIQQPWRAPAHCTAASRHGAKTQLSRLVDRAAKGESFVIAKAGKPMVKVKAPGRRTIAEVSPHLAIA